VSYSSTTKKLYEIRPTLCVDVGNTSVKAELVDPRGIEVIAVEHTRLSATVQRIERALFKTRGRLMSDPDCILCSVVPKVGRLMAKAIRRALGAPPFEIHHKHEFPFALAVDDPAKVGPDRLCAAAGAFSGGAGKRSKHAIIVDIGSAITVDLVRHRKFRGGLIFAGPALALGALGEYARRLPRIDPLAMADASPRKFADTEPSMALGARVSAIGAIKESVQLLQKSTQCRPVVYVTGGFAPVITPHLPASWRHDPHLVTKGMIAIRDRNRRPARA
jgi:type III pantothenate kinase